jgi:hypothetical protein
METLIGKKLRNAIESKSVDISSYIWKGTKKLDETGRYKQSEKKMIDMNETELNSCYEHCKTMLFNKDIRHPGRYLVLDLISEQRNKCGAELFLRYIERENQISRFSLMNMLSEFLTKNKEALKGIKPKLSDVFSNLPNEFEELSLDLVMDGCLDRLGAFNKKHITRTFILKQGIWLTPSESKELIKYSVDKSENKLSIIRDNLNIKDVEILYVRDKGLNYTQMRAMLNIKPNKKYIDLTTTQLETLRYRILFNLEEDVKKHIISWEKRMEEIEEVAEYNNYKLC